MGARRITYKRTTEVTHKGGNVAHALTQEVDRPWKAGATFCAESSSIPDFSSLRWTEGRKEVKSESEVKQCWGGAEQRVDGFKSALQTLKTSAQVLQQDRVKTVYLCYCSGVGFKISTDRKAPLLGFGCPAYCPRDPEWCHPAISMPIKNTVQQWTASVSCFKHLYLYRRRWRLPEWCDIFKRAQAGIAPIDFSGLMSADIGVYTRIIGHKRWQVFR